MTRFLIAGRQTGKTTAAINWVKGGVRRQLVVPDEMQAMHVREMYLRRAGYSFMRGQGSELHPEKIISYSSLMSGRTRGQPFNELAVDNLDMLLTQLFGYHVGFVTATGEEANTSPNTLQLGGPA